MNRKVKTSLLFLRYDFYKQKIENKLYYNLGKQKSKNKLY